MLVGVRADLNRWLAYLEIRGLDGERKALVYDNYSKLITATDTIRKVREFLGIGSSAVKELMLWS